MAEGFPTLAGGLAKGIQSGVAQGAGLAQLRESILARRQDMQTKERTEAWTQAYQKAALGVQVAANKDLPASMRLKGLNNGLLPLWNNPSFDVHGNNASPLPEFTETDLQDNAFQDVLTRAKAIKSNKDLTPQMQDKAIVELFTDYHAKRGETKEAMDMILGGNKREAELGATSAKGADDLRTEFNGLTKEFRSVATSYQRIIDSAKNPTAAGDMALIYNYMKILDPGSTVREGEFATASQAGGLPSRIVAQYNKVVNGERLSSDIRSDFQQRAGELYKGQEAMFTRVQNSYTNLAKQRGLDPSEVGLGDAFTVNVPAENKTSKDKTSKGKTLNPEDEAAAYLGGK